MSRSALGSFLLLVLLWLAGIDLRLTLLALPPVMPLIHRDLDLSEAMVGALTGLPILVLGLAAIPGSLLIVRIGARRAVIVSLVLIAVASALRGVGPSAAMLFAMTFLMGGGIAVAQPALPSLVGRWFAASPARATAVYANGLLVGETLSAALTIPFILPAVGGSWPASFVFWSVPVLVTAILIAAFTPHVPRDPAARPALWWPDWRDRRTWQLGLMMGGCGTMYFGANAFVPDFLHATGQEELIGTCLGWLNAGQLPASFIILFLADRIAGRRAPMIGAAFLGFVGAGLVFTAQPWAMALGSALIGFAAAFVLILALALPPLLTAADDVHRLSAGMFTIGYAVSFTVPLIGGALWDATHSPAMAFLPVAVGGSIVLATATALRPPGRVRSRQPAE